MRTLPQRVPLLIKHKHRQKRNTWKFAIEFLIRKNTTKDQASLGSWTRDQLVELGPTFIKLGQIASTRVDLYPIEFTKQLESLQDDVPPIDPIDLVYDGSKFSYFEEKPFKSASIGQVHMAKLHDGTDVVVKVKRPYIHDIIKKDTDNVLEIVGFLENIGINTGTSNGYVLNETIEYLLKETDYDNEIYNAVRFRKAMKKIKWIKVPKVYENISNDDMIVMEYVPSHKITQIKNDKVNKKKVCESIIQSYLIQTMDKGLFHADPHPGNIGFVDDGKIVFYDFGLVIDVSRELKEGFKKIFVDLINKNTSGVVKTLVDLKIIIPTSNIDEIESFFKNAMKYLETLNVTSNDFDEEVLENLAKTKPFVIPTSIIYLAKTFSTIEGICIKLDEDFTYYKYLEPMLRDELDIDFRETFSMISDMPSKIRDIDKTVVRLEKSKTVMRKSINDINRIIIQSNIINIILLLLIFHKNL